MNITYNDLAIILAWPDTTIRGDERWMMLFRKLGIVKNLNFKVGHTGIILIDSQDHSLLYYDFGRYISPRGLGRARSPFSDPRLKMQSKAVITDRARGEIANLSQIAEELSAMVTATQGYGRLFFSVATDINFHLAKKYADELVIAGSTPYGAFAKGNNNCSRFITRLLAKSSKKYKILHPIHFPETIKSSPLSNVVNVRPDRKICVYTPENGLREIYMSRLQSFKFIVSQLRDNFNKEKAKLLPNDLIIGAMNHQERPANIPENSQWLGGVGEGAWYAIQARSTTDHKDELSDNEFTIEVSRYTDKGELEYCLPFFSEEDFDLSQPYKIIYDSHMLYTSLWQNGKQYRFYSLIYKSTQPIGIVNFKPANPPVAALGFLAKD